MDFSEEESQIASELREWLPNPGDKLIRETISAAQVDPLGYSDLADPENRSPVGRWMLYANGFLMAGDRLVDHLVGIAAEDALIYPVVYLYRHFLELQLKAQILFCQPRLSGKTTKDVQSFKPKRLDNNHSLRNLWEILDGIYPKFADERPNITAAFESLLFELDALDPNSQAPRYALDKKGNQTFMGVQALDLVTFKAGVHKMSHYLMGFEESVDAELESDGFTVTDDQLRESTEA